MRHPYYQSAKQEQHEDFLEKWRGILAASERDSRRVEGRRILPDLGTDICVSYH